jgi:hypothetical protein
VSSLPFQTSVTVAEAGDNFVLLFFQKQKRLIPLKSTRRAVFHQVSGKHTPLAAFLLLPVAAAAAAGLHAIKGARFDMFGISTMEAVKFVNHAPMRLQRAYEFRVPHE